jgi:transposase-like protein
MTKLKFMEEHPLDPKLVLCPHCGEEERIGVHHRAEQLYKCHACERTFSANQGTLFAGLHYPVWVVVLVLTLLAYGCPPAAIVAAFLLDERTLRGWQAKAGAQGKRVQMELVCSGRVELGQVQADELRVKTQTGTVWHPGGTRTAMSVFPRLFLWAEVAPSRNKRLIGRLMDKVAQAAHSTVAPILVAVDGFAAYPKAIRTALHTKLYTGRRGRPKQIPWPHVHIVQLVKSRQGRQLKQIQRRLVQGAWQTVYAMIAMSQVGAGTINTAYIERLNATLRARMPTLVRRTRSLARSVQRLENEIFWTGVVYNFCTVHTSLQATPAMAADLTDHIWSVEELLRLGGPQKSLQGVL